MKYHLPGAKVLGHEQTGEGNFFLTLKAKEMAEIAEPGQFVHLRPGLTQDPLLRRPISICQANRLKGQIMLWYQVVGKGTELLSKVKEGDVLDLIGPLGKPFITDIKGKKIGLIGGGIGIAPLVFLGNELSLHNQVSGFFGIRNRELMLPSTMPLSFTYQMASDDGSVGHHGLVTDLFTSFLSAHKFEMLYTCGPMPMMRKVAQIAQEQKIPLQVSLETTMACGVGACLGCTCEKVQDDDGTWLKVCQDGPVFWAEEVKWS